MGFVCLFGLLVCLGGGGRGMLAKLLLMGGGGVSGVRPFAKIIFWAIPLPLVYAYILYTARRTHTSHFSWRKQKLY